MAVRVCSFEGCEKIQPSREPGAVVQLASRRPARRRQGGLGHRDSGDVREVLHGSRGHRPLVWQDVTMATRGDNKMSGEGFKFQASVKDNDGDMVNVRADSPEELDAYLSNFPVAAYAQFKANVRGGAALGGITQPQAQALPVGSSFGGGDRANAPAQPEWSQPQQAAPQQQSQGWGAAQQQAPQRGVQFHPEGKPCNCGAVLQYKVVNRKSDGKQFKFWACPNQKNRDDGHDTEFAN